VICEGIRPGISYWDYKPPRRRDVRDLSGVARRVDGDKGVVEEVSAVLPSIMKE
jgi:hypothetical protein